MESLFKKVADRKPCSFIKKRPQHSCFHVNIAKFWRLLILKNSERLLFDCFNGSVLHLLKVSRSKLYYGVRFQVLSHRSSILFLSRYLLSWTESRPAFENLRWIPLTIQLSFYIVKTKETYFLFFSCSNQTTKNKIIFESIMHNSYDVYYVPDHL